MEEILRLKACHFKHSCYFESSSCHSKRAQGKNEESSNLCHYAFCHSRLPNSFCHSELSQESEESHKDFAICHSEPALAGEESHRDSATYLSESYYLDSKRCFATAQQDKGILQQDKACHTEDSHCHSRLPSSPYYFESSSCHSELALAGEESLRESHFEHSKISIPADSKRDTSHTLKMTKDKTCHSEVLAEESQKECNRDTSHTLSMTKRDISGICPRALREQLTHTCKYDKRDSSPARAGLEWQSPNTYIDVV
ncbi:hypothetical protein [Helicobacter sp. MIT 14-3879]|uniref:hypothetical protein n=1 Tax=Helicobacter sp. MIT 14-3879 TaxID=2040649 RepID=UPI000E1EDAB5|nr:hypothetical protein [Helicobacter sp. MIT 14-3879]RDU63548.1 hypothetical protein CQA44_05565 [Helicobacter sp. MIT 14-3879]